MSDRRYVDAYAQAKSELARAPDWRQAPASPAQLAALERRGVPAPEGCTKGEACRCSTCPPRNKLHFSKNASAGERTCPSPTRVPPSTSCSPAGGEEVAPFWVDDNSTENG